MKNAAASLLVALALFVDPSPAFAGDQVAAAASPTTITFSFKLDPRLSGPTYGGERWVSPPTYTGASAQDTVEAKASFVDVRGKPTKASIDWAPSDPDLVTVSPPRGGLVRITVKRAGESGLTVTSGGASRTLIVKAVERNGTLQVTISQ